jgi:hypothetical protein
LVASISRQGALVAGLAEDLDGRTADLPSLSETSRAPADNLRAADLAERVRGATAHPPVRVTDGLQQELHGLSPTTFSTSTAARRACSFVLQDLDEVAHRVRVLAVAERRWPGSDVML